MNRNNVINGLAGILAAALVLAGISTPVRDSASVWAEDRQRVVTGPGKTEILNVAPGVEVVVMENTELTVTREKGDTGDIDIVGLFQKSGFTWSRVAPGGKRFKVSTPASVAGIRGTAFSAQVDPQTGEEGFCVCEGVIEVESGGQKGEIRAGEYMGVSKTAQQKKPFRDLILLKYPTPQTQHCLSCHQGGSTRGEY